MIAGPSALSCSKWWSHIVLLCVDFGFGVDQIELVGLLG